MLFALIDYWKLTKSVLGKFGTFLHAKTCVLTETLKCFSAFLLIFQCELCNVFFVVTKYTSCEFATLC